MLERDVLGLLSHGFQNIVVAVGAGERRLISFAKDRAVRVARAAGANLRIHLEKRPLGTIGAARTVGARGEDLLVVNVDNLTSLNLSALLAHHQTTQAAMTIATHTEPFQVPFGQVSIEEGRIIEYKKNRSCPSGIQRYLCSRSCRATTDSLGKTIGVRIWFAYF
jgi:mannose-1-phosphate guanylyltransferase/phosphomannomutase